MNELNDRELGQVSGGLTDSEMDHVADRIYEIVLAKECGKCTAAPLWRPGCQKSLKYKAKEIMKESGQMPPTCPWKYAPPIRL